MSVVRVLTLALTAQIVLAVITWWPQDHSDLLPHSLLELTAAEVTELRIHSKPDDGAEPTPVRLKRDDAGWVIASRGDYPADPAKVASLIDKLVGLQVGPAIASQTSSYNALKVGEDDFGRRVVLVTGNGERELVIGAAQSNSINVRLTDAPEVYVASGVSEWSIQDSARSYWSSAYVSADPSELVSVRVENEHGSFDLSREGDVWALDELPDGTTSDSDAIAEFVKDVTRVNMAEPAGDESENAHGLGSAARISWTIGSDTQSIAGGYAVGAENDSNRYVRSDTSPHTVLVGAYGLSTLLDASRDDFFTQPDEEEEEGNEDENEEKDGGDDD